MKDSIIKTYVLNLLNLSRKCQNKIRVYIGYLRLKKQYHNRRMVETLSFTHSDKVLIMVPHADDELINCHKLINDNKDSILLLFFSLTGTKKDVINKKKREKEFETYCKTSGVKSYIVNSETDNYTQFCNLIEAYKPNKIVLPSFIDWHKEHMLLSSYMYDYLVKFHPSILEYIIIYSVSFPMHSDFVNAICPMSKQEQELKWNLFDTIYKTQSGFPVYRFKYWERLYAKELCNNYSTEYFHVFNKTDWIYWYESMYDGSVCVPQDIINNLIAVRSLSYKLYIDNH